MERSARTGLPLRLACPVAAGELLVRVGVPGRRGGPATAERVAAVLRFELDLIKPALGRGADATVDAEVALLRLPFHGRDGRLLVPDPLVFLFLGPVEAGLEPVVF